MSYRSLVSGAGSPRCWLDTIADTTVCVTPVRSRNDSSARLDPNTLCGSCRRCDNFSRSSEATSASRSPDVPSGSVQWYVLCSVTVITRIARPPPRSRRVFRPRRGPLVVEPVGGQHEAPFLMRQPVEPAHPLRPRSALRRGRGKHPPAVLSPPGEPRLDRDHPEAAPDEHPTIVQRVVVLLDHLRLLGAVRFPSAPALPTTANASTSAPGTSSA